MLFLFNDNLQIKAVGFLKVAKGEEKEMSGLPKSVTTTRCHGVNKSIHGSRKMLLLIGYVVENHSCIG